MTEQIFQQRQTAYKLWIGDLISAKFEKREGDMPLNYVDVKGKKVSRVNLVGSVVFKFENEDKTYLSVTIDDGSGNVRLKTWREDSEILRALNIGDSVLVIGKPRNFNNEIYIVPEIVKRLENEKWLELRKLELVKEYGAFKEEVVTDIETMKVVEEKVVSDEPTESARRRIIDLVEKHSDEFGADIDIIISTSGIDEKDCEEIIDDLLKEGEVFSPKAGKIKLID